MKRLDIAVTAGVIPGVFGLAWMFERDRQHEFLGRGSFLLLLPVPPNSWVAPSPK